MMWRLWVFIRAGKGIFVLLILVNVKKNIVAGLEPVPPGKQPGRFFVF